MDGTKETDMRLKALVDVAARWREPDHPPREAAVAQTLDAPNRWTEEALDYALNRWMQAVTAEALSDWLGAPGVDGASRSVGVLHGDTEPLAGLRAALAVWASGHAYLGHVPGASPALLPALAQALQARHGGIEATFVEDEEALLARADARGTAGAGRRAGGTARTRPGCSAARPMRRPRPSRRAAPPAAAAPRPCGARRPRGRRRSRRHRRLSPDAYLEAMARFRGVFPAHDDTPGALQMQKAFLEAQDDPHAFAAGLEFLVSRGAPKIPQPEGHIRWTEYDALDAVDAWIQEHRDRLCAVVARAPLHDQLPASWPLRTPGDLHLPPLDDAEGATVARFVGRLGTLDA
jgi:hypothetical protein